MDKRDCISARAYFGNRHALAARARGRRQVQRHFSYSGAYEPQVDRRLAPDFIARIGEFQTKHVMHRVDARLPGVGIGPSVSRQAQAGSQRRLHLP